MQRLIPILLLAASALGAQTAASPLELLPYPRQVRPGSGDLQLRRRVDIGVAGKSPQDQFAAQVLADELSAIDHLPSRIRHSDGGTVVLARADSKTGLRLLQRAGLTLPAVARAEGYALVVTRNQAAVVAASSAGMLYGVETLRQLIHPDASGASAATVRIVDWPALRWRGVQMDVSRGAIPSLAAFQRDIPLLAEFKINALVLYFENTFAYPNLPVWAAPGGAITPEEATAIVSLAAKYNLTVIPEQEAFGHLHLGLREERFQDLVEKPYGNLLSPAVPASLDLTSKMFAELAQYFPGPFFHIGADETFDLGTGRSQAMQASEGAGRLYLNYLKAIAVRLEPYHRKILFWGDIAQNHPELLSQLPKDMIAVPWNYGAGQGFVKLIKPFTDAGLATWVAPGVSNWSRIFPDYSEATPNIVNFVRDGRSLGSTGVLNTNWNDDGESMFDYCWYGVALGSAEGWEDQPSLPRFQNAYDWALYRADGHDFLQQVETLTQVQELVHKAVHTDATDSAMWHEAFSPEGQRVYGEMAPVAPQVRLLAEDVIASMAEHREGARRYRDLLLPVEFAARRFDFVGEKAIYAVLIVQLYQQASTPGLSRGKVNGIFSRINSINGLLQDMRDGVTTLRGEYQTLWLEGNTPYFLGNILVRYDNERLYWENQARRFSRIRRAYDTQGTLPPLISSGGN
ncbi:MAG: glycoside hydrolase family 20 zincin-like fold domain-containing protein [Terriglobales bacterium]